MSSPSRLWRLCEAAMNPCEDREVGVHPSKATLCGGHDSQTKAHCPEPEPSCVSMKSDASMEYPLAFRKSADGR